MSQHRIPFDEILEIANDDRKSHMVRMLEIRKICVREIDKANAVATEVKRGPGRPPKVKDDGAESGDKIQGQDTPPT